MREILATAPTTMPTRGSSRGNPDWIAGRSPVSPGRPVGSRNRLRPHVVLAAAEAFGDDIADRIAQEREAKGLPPLEHQLRGEAAYIRWLMESHPPAGAALYARTMPNQTQMEIKNEPAEPVVYHTIEAFQERLKQLGVELPGGRIYPLLFTKDKPPTPTEPSKEDEPS
jgi:hypothetical protein